MPGFQSIGATKDWRPLELALPELSCSFSFQSIGVTKDWRPEEPSIFTVQEPATFPINRRHQGLATGIDAIMTDDYLRRFQSIGVTKDWRLIGGKGDTITLHFRVSNQ